MSVGPYPVSLAIERLSAHAPLLKLVGDAADLQAAFDATPVRAPAAYVLCEERGGAIKYTGPVTIQDVEVALQLVLFVRNATKERTGAGARRAMDEVIGQCRAALLGWAPGDSYDALSFWSGRDERYSGSWLVAQQVYRGGYRISHQVTP
ncbi:phage tail terminator protein [Vulcaniibacterium tengchongense]|uniref:DUF3168 domain-containing protein n=1 Tax=Vulcaniibacterium tengchongense TaxID=1273429 RepID=A0A3N4W9C0_9GAMM|nr:hypothetical protein [Vulcaniibacterium tengchongense]RPE81844.1 hypothetical protein EDC50_1046 [Vulcaniibacterium tengchongense]